VGQAKQGEVARSLEMQGTRNLQYGTTPSETRKPEAASRSLLVLIGQGVIEKDGFLIIEKYWVEIPKDKALTILALNYLPDAQSRGFQTQNNP
jgi:hypothetical protein